MCQKNSIDELFYKHVYLVDSIIKKLKYDFIEYDDMYQSGLMGLYEACKKFNEEKGVKFSSFAVYYVLGEIKREIRENKLIIYSKNVYRVLRELNKGTNLTEISKKIGISDDFVHDVYLSYSNIVSLNNVNNEGNELISMVSGNKKLSDIINLCLDDEHLEIIKLRFIKGYSQKEIAKIYKCDQSKISRLCKKALDKMREYYLKEEVDIY